MGRIWVLLGFIWEEFEGDEDFIEWARKELEKCYFVSVVVRDMWFLII